MNKIQISKYSERAIVVTGDTKPVKDILRTAGGKFNARLTNPTTHTPIMGWIFSKSRQTELETLLTGNKISFDVVTPENINSGNHNDYIQDPGEIAADNWAANNL